MKAEAKFSVVRVDNGIKNPHTGVVSDHNTRESALEAIDSANRKLRKQEGQQSSWHPYAVLDNETGEKFEQ